MQTMWRVVVAAATVALTLGACGGDGGARPEPSADTVQVVVIGDSLINPKNGCPEGCTGFAEQFTDHVASVVGTPAEYQTVPAGGVPEAVEAVSETGTESSTLAAADVVVVEVGFNNALPDPGTGIGCGTWFLDTEPGCLAEGVATYGDLYDEVFSGLKSLRGDRPTVYIATTTINGNITPAESFPDGLLALDPTREPEMRQWAVDAYNRWDTMLTERARAAGFQIVDLYHAMNGPDGTKTNWPEYTDDGAHPNRAGHDLIASLLARADLSAISR